MSSTFSSASSSSSVQSPCSTSRVLGSWPDRYSQRLSSRSITLTSYCPASRRARRSPTLPPPAIISRRTAAPEGCMARSTGRIRSASASREDLVARQDARAALAGDQPLFPVQRHQPHGRGGKQLAQLGDRVVHHRAAVRGPHGDQQRPPLGELQHLQRLGVVDQLLHILHQRLLGADHVVHREAALAQQGIPLLELRAAQPGDGRGDLEHVVGDLAGHEVGLVQRRAGDQHVGVLAAGAAQDFGMDAVARHPAQVQALLQLAQALRVGVDHCDVVAFRDQALGNAFADPAGSEDDDSHAACAGPTAVPRRAAHHSERWFRAFKRLRRTPAAGCRHPSGVRTLTIHPCSYVSKPQAPIPPSNCRAKGYGLRRRPISWSPRIIT